MDKLCIRGPIIESVAFIFGLKIEKTCTTSSKAGQLHAFGRPIARTGVSSGKDRRSTLFLVGKACLIGQGVTLRKRLTVGPLGAVEAHQMPLVTAAASTLTLIT
jgi:hypothetical protein